MAAGIIPLMLAKRDDVKQAMIDQRCKVMIEESRRRCATFRNMHIYVIHPSMLPTGTDVHVASGVLPKMPSAPVAERRTCCAWRETVMPGRASWFMSSHI
jgi:hypothetical protein